MWSSNDNLLSIVKPKRFSILELPTADSFILTGLYDEGEKMALRCICLKIGTPKPVK